MIKLFKKKTALDNLYDNYEKLMKEAHKLSTIDRAASDKKHAEAEQLIKKIEELKNESH
ncbi:MAG: Lacal_2735 family protein [Crocinitomicaceae bacterium]